MAKGVNKVIILGRLGADPEVNYGASGTAVAKLSIATNSSRKDPQSGDWIDETEWHRVTLFGRTAEIAGEYLRKGREVYIEGRLRTNKWQDKQTGQDRWMTEIIGNDMQMLGGRADSEYSGAPAPDNRSYAAPAAPPPSSPPPAAASPAPAPVNDFDDDIPF